MKRHTQSYILPHFYSSSGGNAGLACVTAARQLGCEATVVVPLSTKPLMIERIVASGATDVIRHGATWKEADNYLRQVVLKADEAGVYVPPFDHEDIWDGNATLVHELWEQMARNDTPHHPRAAIGNDSVAPKALVCSVGGGGLFCGLVRGMSSYPSWSNVSIVAVETRGADSLHHSIKADKLVTLPGITSQATSLGATRVASQCFRYAQQENVHSVVVSDDDAAQACLTIADQEHLLVELACGASVATCFKGRLNKALGGDLKPEDVVVIVLCGGSNVTVEMLAQWRQEHHSRLDLFNLDGANRAAGRSVASL